MINFPVFCRISDLFFNSMHSPMVNMEELRLVRSKKPGSRDHDRQAFSGLNVSKPITRLLSQFHIGISCTHSPVYHRFTFTILPITVLGTTSNDRKTLLLTNF